MDMATRFSRKILANTWRSTSCTCYVSVWHLMALGLLPPDRVKQVLASTIGADGSQLLDDLCESTTMEISLKSWVAGGVPYQDAIKAPSLIDLSVEQMCRYQGVSLLGWYWPYAALDWPCHPIVSWFENWITAKIGEDGEVIPGSFDPGFVPPKQKILTH